MPDDAQRQAVDGLSAGLIDESDPSLQRFGTGGPRTNGSEGGAPCYGAIDLGTNNCRLLIARPARNGFRVVDAFSRIVRLGEGLMESRRLSDAAQDRAVKALAVCSDKLARRGVRLARHVATEACRQAENCDAFVERVYDATGLHLDVITPAEEARLAVLGCQALFDWSAQSVLVFDIGGGSTEISLARLAHHGSSIVAWTSVPWGVVSLAETLSGADVSPASYAGMKERVRQQVSAFAKHPEVARVLKEGRAQMLGTSGTVTTLASLHLGLPVYDRRQVDGAVVDSASMHRICTRLAAMDHMQRVAEPCIGTERADLVVPGCAILEAILETWPFERLTIADRGIREGVLRTLIQRDSYAN